MKGDYVLLMKLRTPHTMTVGRLGVLPFRDGYYAYVGSGRGSLEARIERHRQTAKRTWWHIDYLLRRAELIDILYAEGSQRRECHVAKILASTVEVIPRFGASDCRCPGHLFFSRDVEHLRQKVARAFHVLGLEMRRIRL